VIECVNQLVDTWEVIRWIICCLREDAQSFIIANTTICHLVAVGCSQPAACPRTITPTITITFIMRSVCGPPHKTSRRAAEDSCGDGESDGGVCRGLVGSVHSRRTTNDERQWGNGPHTKTPRARRAKTARRAWATRSACENCIQLLRGHAHSRSPDHHNAPTKRHTFIVLILASWVRCVGGSNLSAGRTRWSRNLAGRTGLAGLDARPLRECAWPMTSDPYLICSA